VLLTPGAYNETYFEHADLDYADVSPLRGVVLGGGAHRMTVAVDVTPLE
jgi:hypothetical protein